MALTDYKEWLGAIHPNTEEVYHIYNAIESLQNVGQVTITSIPDGKGGDNWLVSYPNMHDPNLILTAKSREAILKEIISKYCNGMDMESWHGFETANKKSIPQHLRVLRVSARNLSIDPQC